MIATFSDQRLARLHDLYEGLARYHWLCRRLRRAAPGEGLEMHKSLGPPAAGREGPPGGRHLHDWLWQAAGLGGGEAPAAPGGHGDSSPRPPAAWASPRPPRVLEVGCGFGATSLHWARTRPGTFVAIGDSAYQIARARAEAGRLPLLGRCEFSVQSYDEPVAGTFDAVLGVETFLHASHLAATVRGLARCLVPGGRLVAVEDVARDERGASEASALAAAWSAPRIWSAADWEAAAAGAGLTAVAIHDLSAQVQPRPEPARQRAQAWLLLLRRLAPTRRLRGVVDAFLGGIELERLHERGAMLYRCMVFARTAGARP